MSEQQFLPKGRSHTGGFWTTRPCRICGTPFELKQHPDKPPNPRCTCSPACSSENQRQLTAEWRSKEQEKRKTDPKYNEEVLAKNREYNSVWAEENRDKRREADARVRLNRAALHQYIIAHTDADGHPDHNTRRRMTLLANCRKGNYHFRGQIRVRYPGAPTPKILVESCSLDKDEAELIYKWFMEIVYRPKNVKKTAGGGSADD